jgi:hypothetical protein
MRVSPVAFCIKRDDGTELRLSQDECDRLKLRMDESCREREKAISDFSTAITFANKFPNVDTELAIRAIDLLLRKAGLLPQGYDAEG